MKAIKCFEAINHEIRSKNVTRKGKIRILQTVILPTLLYRSNTWVLTKKCKEALLRCYKKIYGGFMEERRCKIYVGEQPITKYTICIETPT